MSTTFNHHRTHPLPSLRGWGGRPRAALRVVFACLYIMLASVAGPRLTAQGPGRPGGGMPGHPGMQGMPGPRGPSGPGGFGGGRTSPPGGLSRGSNPPVGNVPITTPGGTLGPRLQVPAGRWWNEQKYAGGIGLTGDQQRRMDSVFQENRRSLVSGLDSLRRAETRLEALSAGDHPNEAAILDEIQNVAQARADLAKTNAHLQLQLRNELTNEQIEKLEKLK